MKTMEDYMRMNGEMTPQALERARKKWNTKRIQMEERYELREERYSSKLDYNDRRDSGKLDGNFVMIGGERVPVELFGERMTKMEEDRQ